MEPPTDEPTTDREDSAPDTASRAALEELLQADARSPFGPRFFLEQLAAFVRERCPESSERLPRVDLWVHGEPIAICHVMAVAPRWVAVAARADHEDSEMRTELVVYESIGRVTISGAAPGPRTIGFRQEHRPVVLHHDHLSPEEALAAAARLTSMEADG